MEKLGFAEDFSVDGWSFLSRGACKLRLGIVPMRCRCRRLRITHGLRTFTSATHLGLYQETVQNGVEIWHKLADKPWGMRELPLSLQTVTGLCLEKDYLFGRMQKPKAGRSDHALQRTADRSPVK